MGLTFDAALAAFEPALPAAVGFSGGADSTALLLGCAAKWPGHVSAIHVHHGLQAAADSFEVHCRALCERLRVPLAVHRVDARHAPGESPEDAARIARYAALAQAATSLGARSVLLAQHADDQVETLLLALGRGAGLPGMAGMPARFERHGVRFERPLLGVSGAAIREWLAARGEPFADDPMNADPAFTRSRIRHEVLPALAKALPAFRDTFARSARHAAQAQALIEDIAAQDLRAAGDPPALAPLRDLTRARQANLLRHWLKTVHGQQASAAQLDELLDQVAACATRGHDIRLKVGTGFVRRQGERLAFTL
ncbi:MAG: tRNA lysidine(34) synthetase TilS [Ramlibacter sp.]